MTTLPEVPLYLSRLLLNPCSRQVMSEIVHPYEMHRTLMRAFPKVTDDTQSGAREEFGVLFRADVDEAQGVIKVFVQSHIKPNWSFLGQIDNYLSAETDIAQCEFKDIMPACQNIRDGQVLLFRLRANPTKRIAKHDDKMRGKRVELRREEEQIDWLIRKGLKTEGGVSGGFELVLKNVRQGDGNERQIPRIKVVIEGKQKARKKERDSGRVTTHFAVIFDGLLRVTDSSAFLETVVRGIGAGKAFGFALLSVAPCQACRSEEEA